MEHIRNIAIIAHVDHGKTTLVDKLLSQSDKADTRAIMPERVMDSNDLEKERGITILSKNTAIEWKNTKINIVDTPGHADFGGEVERILSMVDSVLLVVDAVEGPMPQTRFVTQKAFQKNLNPIVVINKIDRDGAKPDTAIDQVFELFDKLGATNEQLDFPVIYTSAINGFATLDLNQASDSMAPLLDLVIAKVPPPKVSLEGEFQMQISTLDYSDYLGVIGIGRVHRGSISANKSVSIVDKNKKIRSGKIYQLLGYMGLDRQPVDSIQAGDIAAITGIEGLTISDTVCAKETPEGLPPLSVDEPTISMTFQVNDSPFAGRTGKFITSRQIRDRLRKEAIHNIALRVEDTSDPDKFLISGRGELHLSILLETMRREGYELAVSQPKVIIKEENGQSLEPYEQLVMDIEENHQGDIIQYLGEKRGQLVSMVPDNKGRVRLEYIIPSRSLIGFHSLFLTLTSGSGVITHVFAHYGPMQTKIQLGRNRGVLIAKATGVASAYSLWNLQPRGKLFIGPQTEIYAGMVIGIHSRENDLIVNAIKEKKLTNIRAAGNDENITLTPPIPLTLEYALDFINDDELAEITPTAIRLRKKHLNESDRKRQGNL